MRAPFVLVAVGETEECKHGRAKVSVSTAANRLFRVGKRAFQTGEEQKHNPIMLASSQLASLAVNFLAGNRTAELSCKITNKLVHSFGSVSMRYSFLVKKLPVKCTT